MLRERACSKCIVSHQMWNWSGVCVKNYRRNLWEGLTWGFAFQNHPNCKNMRRECWTGFNSNQKIVVKGNWILSKRRTATVHAVAVGGNSEEKKRHNKRVWASRRKRTLKTSFSFQGDFYRSHGIPLSLEREHTKMPVWMALCHKRYLARALVWGLLRTHSLLLV